MATTAQAATTATPTPTPTNSGPTTGQFLVWALLIAAVVFVGWRISLVLHPYRHCRKCGGTPRFYGSVATKSFRLCDRCQGTGRELRLGAKDRF